MMPAPFFIGSVRVDPPILSAPMAGFTNYAFREVLRKFGGAGLIATEMLSARSFACKEANPPPYEEALARLWGIREEPRPLAAQIWDNQPETLAHFGEVLVREYRVSVIDLNFGCPAPAIAKNSSSGSWLLKSPEKVADIITQVVKACSPAPVTAKIRLGWTRDTINAVDVAQAAEDAGAAAITVHGRTAQEMYRGTADWEAIAKIKRHLKRIPLIGNGDIRTVEQAVTAFSRYPVDGIMLGRVALEKPWIFRQISQALAGETVSPDPALTEQKETLLEHYRLMCGQFGEEKGTILMRKTAPCYAKGIKGARSFRTAICQAATAWEFLELVDRLFPTEE
ncbi:MAG: tRNA dihydrouridine synthase DusB [Planctomycetaceae bacterium]|jgi:tRNA-dihydrouridine synthase B|nr:tRNA dihydrouridine synthase DusB [Planctomycetaceae bacterium]